MQIHRVSWRTNFSQYDHENPREIEILGEKMKIILVVVGSSRIFLPKSHRRCISNRLISEKESFPSFKDMKSCSSNGSGTLRTRHTN